MKRAMHLALTVLCSLPMLAGDAIKTFPPAMYDAMKGGKKLDKVFIDPAYDRSKGFKMGAIDYHADFRSSQVIESLPKALGAIAKGDGEYTLKIAVVKVTTFSAGGWVKGKLGVEGQIVDKEGRVLVAFATTVSSAGGINGDDYMLASDKIASAIYKDLL
jgi:hypothetical protein